MCYVIVTGRSLLWTLLSLAALMAVLSALLTPKWLVGPHTIKDTTFGLAVMTMTVLAALIGCCVQSIGRKSIFDLSGVAQAIAGILYLIGLSLYPAGWGAERVKRICGPEADAFYLGDCNLGWAFYSALVGTGLTFAAAMLSGQAEKSTASDKVQDKMNEGRMLICLA
ncbi:PREDICTED: lipoma HMGIC fusion partner-like 2 protein isoform X2 [Polistes dominula]|uniref:Lipoma HMGIC fusion partner-like 2 protein isoform X2 n=1 Tax=Polistes dominula TaxID=743375 RepID=A0ABM1IHG8_POLDO|nr:PREDICTED: lipoma HMGIC fusion partner-like 2 protein isoform X2 [Polistes dominula]